jgi:hypothetical protein
VTTGSAEGESGAVSGMEDPRWLESSACASTSRAEARRAKRVARIATADRHLDDPPG